MMLLTSLLLSGLLMTQADRIKDDLNVPPLLDPVYVFEVRTESPVSDVKAALSNVTIRQSFKIIGENQYFFVVASNDTGALRHLAFPAGSVVTQYPAEHVEEYMRMFGIGSGWEESWDNEDFFADDAIVTLFDCRLLFPDHISARDFDSIIKEWGETFREAHGVIKPLLYAAIGSYPPRFIIFAAMEGNAIQTFFAKDIVRQFRGPAAVFNQIKHAVRI